MSTLKDLTRNSVQSGLSASKWLSLCKLFVSKNQPAQDVDVGSQLSTSVLVLFSDYPGDPTLQAYLKCAIQDGMIPLATFVRSFLAAAKSPSMHNSSTLDMLCRIAVDYHYSTGLDPIGSLVPLTESPAVVFETVHHALSLLKTAFDLPATHFHQFTTSASELLILLLTCVNDFTQLNTNQAVTHFAEDASGLLAQPGLSPDVKHVLEQFILSLSYLLGEDAKAAREAEMVHSTLGKSHAVTPNSDSEIVSCSLLLRSLVARRVSEFGAGDGRHAIVLLIALVRSSSWTPTAFYTQLLLAAATCVAQEANSGVSTKSSLLWRAFVIGRLPHLISMFTQAVELDGVTISDWRQAMSAALASLLQEEDILAKCDLLYHHAGSDSTASLQHPFLGEFLHQLSTAGVIEPGFVSTLRTNLSMSELHPRMQSEAQEHASELDAYIESKLGIDTSADDIASLIERIWQDSCSHAAFAEAVRRRFRNCASSLDIEALGHLCEILYTHEFAMEILSLHVTLSDLVGQALVILEDYDCETVGKSCLKVPYYCLIVGFSTVTLSTTALQHGDRRPSPAILNSAASLYRMEELTGEESAAFATWHKALFDSGSEGIEDSILRSTRPKTLLHIAATLVCHAVAMCAENKLDKDVLNNGISYFLGPLLNWTLVGVIKVLLMEIQHRSYAPPVHLQVEVLQTLLQSTSCPKQVLKLVAAAILRALPEGNVQGQQRMVQFDPVPIRQVALKTLGLPIEGQGTRPHK
ncbi:hypothetical protein NM688_g5076 [Phlebia brevispora]|uniref:Uncharacterized protein n=1 Tax=Phlebia brevispora TaxID=194682 RepID=A0ACC1T0V9_9APHY|nr:hypothetical protein NM688_g5076 [Phlebia brevispora]